MIRPKLTLLDQPAVERILSEAYQLLEDPGVRVHSERALRLLAEAGARVDAETRVAHIPAGVVERCVASVPRSFNLYNASGEPVVHYGGDDVHFDPGSASIEILDYCSGESRKPVTADLVRATRLADRLPAIDAMSTCLV
jgi:trimethylamine:corrinoid methyltransferase-like protein